MLDLLPWRRRCAARDVDDGFLPPPLPRVVARRHFQQYPSRRWVTLTLHDNGEVTAPDWAGLTPGQAMDAWEELIDDEVG